MPSPLDDSDLIIHVLNVGHGDTLIVELPREANGEKAVAVVDCCVAEKALGYLEKIDAVRPWTRLEFVCATHPHGDHISGMLGLMRDMPKKFGARGEPRQFWDSGFRHQSATYQRILRHVRDHNIPMVRVSSGMERYFGPVRLTALAPSVALRNRYATYGVDMNNASIVLRLEYCADNVVTVESMRYRGRRDPEWERERAKNVAILAGDAEFDSWARIAQEYPFLERTATHDPAVKKMLNLLNCWLLKVAHHGSMHSAPFDIFERMSPALAVVSCQQRQSSKNVPGGVVTRGLFPHDTTVRNLEETKTRILTTDGSYESSRGDASYGKPGTVVVAFRNGMNPRFGKAGDEIAMVPDVLTEL